MKFNNLNQQIHPNAKIGQGVEIGDYTIIYDNVIIGDNSIIADHCVIGEPLNSYYRNRNLYDQPETKIGANSLIRSFSIIYAGSTFGNNLNTGHHATIREFTQIGHHCSIGSYNDIQGSCEIGEYCRFHSYVNIGQKSKIGSFVFIYPFTVLTNDPTPPSNKIIGPEIGDYTQIAAQSTLLPSSKIGEHCLISAGSVVGGTFIDNSFISGSPAKRIGDLHKMPFYNEKGVRHYPWPFHFERGMPWEKTGFKKWQTNHE
jgi:UDP-3-O-[3-hydroxymyristoyl] glucosamine N-acyltransferase